MLFKKHNSYKPLYKQFIKLKENIQNREKIFRFYKQKWKFFIVNYKKKLSWYNKFKPQDQLHYTVSKFSNKKNSYKKRYLNASHAVKRFKLFYGGLKHSVLKKKLYSVTKNIKNYRNLLVLKQLFLEVFEKRLDTVLYRSKFSLSIRNSRQLISHGKIFVNNKKIKNKSFTIKPGDLVTVESKSHYLIIKNLKAIKNLKVCTIPAKHLTINYKTLQIIVGNFQNIQTNINFNLNLEKIININKLFFSSSVVEQVAVNYLDVGSNPA